MIRIIIIAACKTCRYNRTQYQCNYFFQNLSPFNRISYINYNIYDYTLQPLRIIFIRKSCIIKLVIKMKRIKELRDMRNMSQQRLADELNVTQAMISKYEIGISEPDIGMIKRIAEFFGVTSDYLLEISNEKISISASGLSKEENDVLFGFKRLDKIQKAKLQAYLQGLLQE